jgi:hydroxyethylthiazole kinase-like uncharacterized protein yjeF
MHGGAGYVVLAGQEPAGGAPHALVRRTLRSKRDLDILLADERIDAVVIGPGLGRDQQARNLLDAALACAHDLVIDGDALTLLGRDMAARIAADRRTVCVTPHAGEFARMFPFGGNKFEQTLAAAQESGAIVVHKGAATVIAAPDGRAIVASGTSPWLSTAGSGDVLAGLVATQLSANATPLDAASAAVWLHARAATLAGVAFTADDLVGHIPEALARCRAI